MVKKPSSDWERVQIEEWAFSVAALRWGRDEYWKASRSEFKEARKMWMRINGIETEQEAPTQAQTDSMSEYLKNAFGGKTEVIKHG